MKLFKVLLKRYKLYKRSKFLKQPSEYKYQYGVIGAGQHNINNLFPILWLLGVPIKAVNTSMLKTARKAASRWTDCIGSDDINFILNNKSIKAVIVSTLPELHAEITKLLLQHNKHVFVEKPVGFSEEELTKVISEQKNLICQVGLQRRFAPITKQLKKQIKNCISYTYHFCIGAYPEGKELYELFLHPIDFVLFLFGDANIEYVSKNKHNHSYTYFLILNHHGVKGFVELSTAYSWQSAIDQIIINTSTAVITANFPDSLFCERKPLSVLNIPIEKVFPRPLISKSFIKNNFLPVEENNSLTRQGFYPELKHFIKLVESNTTDPLSKLESLLPAYRILEVLKKL